MVDRNNTQVLTNPYALTKPLGAEGVSQRSKHRNAKRTKYRKRHCNRP